ncbi:MAG: sulfite exporter TauE/SafE family protein [Pseudomonadota bacterium]
MELSATFFLLAIPAVIVAGISKGGFGGGAVFVAAPLMAVAVDPAFAVGLMLPLLMLMDVAALRHYWREWHWDKARHLIYGALPGVLIGWLTFRYVSADGVRLLVGGIVVVFTVQQIAARRGLLKPGETFATPLWGWFWGTVAGFTSFVSHAGGPPSAMYLLGNRLSKTQYQASTVLAFWWINLLKLPAYLVLGLFTWQTFIADLILAPVALLSVALGVRAHRVIPEKVFFNLTYVLLFLTGSKLIYDALT